MDSMNVGEEKWHAGNIAVVMVGLPASGKTFTARNLCRYLRWLGVKTRNFSVAHYRNRMVGENLTAEFFDANNQDNLRKRTEIADSALDDLIRWFEAPDGGQVAILDASNTQPQRRKTIVSRLAKSGIRTMFLECVYSRGHDIAVIEHIKELRLTCPEYTNVECEQATNDFNRRLDYYRPHYVPVGFPIEECDYPFIRLLGGGKKIVANQIRGYLPSRMLYYLMNLHYGPKRIFLFPLPRKALNVQEAVSPAQHYLTSTGNIDSLSVWTETSLISCVIGQVFKGHELITKPQLRGLDGGIVENLSAEEVQRQYPEDYAAHQADRYYHRYQRAESYHDLAVRLENVMLELERDPNDVLIVADLSVLQCIYAYFLEIPNKEIPNVEMPLGTMVELKPKAYGVFERRISVDTDTMSPKESEFRPFT